MRYGLYINNEIVFCSTNKYECMTKGVEVLTKEWSNFYSNADSEQTAKFLDEICNFTYNARKASGLDFYADCHFGDKYIEVKPIAEKTYEIIYKISFEKDVMTNEDYIFMEQKFLCYENKFDKIMSELRKRLEFDVWNNISVNSIRCESFDDMLGKEVECLQDEKYTYDVLDTIHKKYYTITSHEVNFN